MILCVLQGSCWNSNLVSGIFKFLWIPKIYKCFPFSTNHTRAMSMLLPSIWMDPQQVHFNIQIRNPNSYQESIFNSLSLFCTEIMSPVEKLFDKSKLKHKRSQDSPVSFQKLRWHTAEFILPGQRKAKCGEKICTARHAGKQSRGNAAHSRRVPNTANPNHQQPMKSSSNWSLSHQSGTKMTKMAILALGGQALPQTFHFAFATHSLLEKSRCCGHASFG